MSRLACFLFLFISGFVLHSVDATWYMPSTRSTAWKLEETFLKLGKSFSFKARSPPAQDVKKIDLLFIVDGFKDVDLKRFHLIIEFIQKLLQSFSISPAATKVGLVTNGKSLRTEIKFNQFANRECLTKALAKIRFSGGFSPTNKALQQAIKLFSDVKGGARKKEAKKIVFFLTDGSSSLGIKTYRQAHTINSLRSNVIIFAFGIGHKTSGWELKRITSSWWRIFRARDYGDLRTIASHLHGHSFESCHSRVKHQYDECGRRCSCKNGKLVKCCRVRKDFTSMAYIERERYVKALKTISTKHPYKARYDNLIDVHRRFFTTRIHTREEFLPWHRWFILQLENLLREVDCRVTVPYWDWSLWSHDPWSTNATSLWHSSKRGLGGDGNAPSGCVNTGPFKRSIWNTTTGSCLMRFFNGATPDAAQVQICLNFKAFTDFELFLRINLHDVVHCLIGGTMCSIDSANAPEFFLHHGFIDKLWADWQKMSLANKKTYFPQINLRLQSSKYYPRDLIDIARQPGCVKACYDEPRIHDAMEVKHFLNGLSTRQLSKLSRLPFSKISEKSLNMFQVSEEERKKARAMEIHSWAGVVTKSTPLKLKEGERIIGFQYKSKTIRG